MPGWQNRNEPRDVIIAFDGTAVALVRFMRLTLKIQERVEDQEKRRMAAVVRERPTTGYALEVDGRLKTELRSNMPK